MNNNDLYENNNDEELLYKLAFEQINYTDEIISQMKESLLRHNLEENDIIQFRKSKLKRKTGIYKCTNCQKEWNLKYEDLIAGEYICPFCETPQKIAFTNVFSDESDNVKQNKVLYGIGGWLGLLAFGLVIGLLFDIKYFSEDVTLNSEILNFTIILDTVLLVILLRLLFIKHRLYPNFQIGYFIINILLSYFFFLNFPNDSEISRNFIGSIIYGTVWSIYLLRSKRVKVTFSPDKLVKSNKNSYSIIDNLRIITKSHNRPSDSFQIKTNTHKPTTPNNKTNTNNKTTEPVKHISLLCPSCNSKVSKDHDYCPFCSEILETFLCCECKVAIMKNYEFCPKCRGKI